MAFSFPAYIFCVIDEEFTLPKIREMFESAPLTPEQRRLVQHFFLDDTSRPTIKAFLAQDRLNYKNGSLNDFRATYAEAMGRAEKPSGSERDRASKACV